MFELKSKALFTLYTERVNSGLTSGVPGLNRLYSDFKRPPKWSTKSNYYEILGLSPKAKHGEIKSAYYKLSMRYHPDKSGESGSKDATDRFREITEAYEVLGNYNSKRNYDRELFAGKSEGKGHDFKVYRRSHQQGPIDTQDYTQFYKRRQEQKVNGNKGNLGMSGNLPPVGQTEHYDYDAFYRMHYSSTTERRKESSFKTDYRKKQNTLEQDNREHGILLLFFFLLMAVGFVMSEEVYIRKDFDAMKDSDATRKPVKKPEP